MSILRAFSSCADFDDPINRSNTTSSNISPYVLEGFRVTNAATNTLITPKFRGVDDIWLSAYIFNHNYDVSRFLSLLNSDSLEIFRIIQGVNSSTHSYRVAAYNGSTWTTLFTGAATLTPNKRYRLDWHIKVHDTEGVAELYIDGELYGSFTGDTNLITNSIPTYALFSSNYSSGTTWSGVIIADEDTRSMHLIQSKPSGAGGETGWSDSYAALSNAGINLSNIKSFEYDDKVTYQKTALSNDFSTGYDVEALVTSIRGLSIKGILKSLYRISGVTYESQEIVLNKKVGTHLIVQEFNPATDLPWSFAQANAVEVGAKFVETNQYRFIRISVTNQSSYLRLREVELYSDVNAVDKLPVASISGSTNTGSTESPDKAYDGNTSTQWANAQSDTAPWIKFDLGEGKEAEIQKIGIYWNTLPSSGDYRIEYSNDDETWHEMFPYIKGDLAYYDPFRFVTVPKKIVPRNRIYRLSMVDSHNSSWAAMGYVDLRTASGRSLIPRGAEQLLASQTQTNTWEYFENIVTDDLFNTWTCAAPSDGGTKHLYIIMLDNTDVDTVVLRAGSSVNARAWKAFNLDYSEDGGVTWNNVLTITGEAAWAASEERTYSVT